MIRPCYALVIATFILFLSFKNPMDESRLSLLLTHDNITKAFSLPYALSIVIT
jgi:hypothetical protein